MSVGLRRLPALQGLLAVPTGGAASAAAVIWCRAALTTACCRGSRAVPAVVSGARCGLLLSSRFFLLPFSDPEVRAAPRIATFLSVSPLCSAFLGPHWLEA
jgi:hypothetical protein